MPINKRWNKNKSAATSKKVDQSGKSFSQAKKLPEKWKVAQKMPSNLWKGLIQNDLVWCITGVRKTLKKPLSWGKATGKRTLQPRANALYAMHRSPGAGIHTFLFLLNHNLPLKSGCTVSEDWTLNENATTARTKELYMISSQISTDYRCSESYLLLTINHQIEY